MNTEISSGFRKAVLIIMAAGFMTFIHHDARAELEKLDVQGMSEVDAQGFANFTYNPEYTYEIYSGPYQLPANTWTGHEGTQTRTFKVARLELNVETEFYLEADSMKCGLSQRDDFYIRNNFFNKLIIGKGDSVELIGHGMEVNNHYQSLWIDIIGDNYRDNIFRGTQGVPDNTARLVTFDVPLGPNKNYYDWDLNFQGVKLGEDNTHPFKMPNLVFKAYYDENNKLRKVAFGSSYAEGKFSGNLIRYTGIVNPNLADPDNNTNGLFDKLTQIAKNPVAMKRDSFIGNNWQFFNFEKVVKDDGTVMDHRGFWFVLGDHDDHRGWEMVCGYPEPMLDFDYRNPDMRLPGYVPGH